MRPSRIVIFAKEPVPGRVKTRLIPALGPQGAAELAARMLAHTVENALATGLATELCGDPDPALWYRGSPLHLSDQGAGDLGERLSRAAERVTERGEALLLIGADCPELDERRLSAAARALNDYDAVIHPVKDGGYALLGLRRFDPSLFTDIAWGTAMVAAATMRRISALGWSLQVHDTLGDVDEPEDLGLVGLGSDPG